MFFWLEPKEPKVQGQMNAPPFVRPTHRHSDNLKVVCLSEVEGRRPCCVLCGATGGAVFRPAFFTAKSLFYAGRNKALELYFVLKNRRLRTTGETVPEFKDFVAELTVLFARSDAVEDYKIKKLKTKDQNLNKTI